MRSALLTLLHCVTVVQPTVCENPAELAGRSWLSLAQADLACPPRVSVRQPDQGVGLGGAVELSCQVTGSHTRLYWVRSGHIVTNNSASRDGGTQVYRLYSEVGVKRPWLNLTILNLDRFGSGVYSCQAESEGGGGQGNATVVITQSITAMVESHLNVLVVCILSFVIVFLIVFLSMVFFALNLKKRHKNLRLIDNNTEETVGPGGTMLILNEETFDPRIIDLEREKNCNSSTSQNSDSGLGSSSSNIVRQQLPHAIFTRIFYKDC